MITMDSTIQVPAISLHRSKFIDIRLKQFLRDNQIRKWPLDCVVLLRQMKASGKYGIQRIVTSSSLSDKVDAATQYNRNTGQYTILFNRQKFYYPFQKSAHRRLNFTIAHEIGHIVLDHLYLPSKLKSSKDTYLEEREADEFAARLLMPEELLCSFNYYSFEAVAEWLNVSNSALFTRLQRVHRVDLILSRKVISCTRCGNIRFSPFAAYCGVCGQSHNKGSHGIRRIYYPDEVRMDYYKRSVDCPKCDLSFDGIKGDRCPSCHTSIFNECSDSFHGNNDNYNTLNNHTNRYHGNDLNAQGNSIYSIASANKSNGNRGSTSKLNRYNGNVGKANSNVNASKSNGNISSANIGDRCNVNTDKSNGCSVSELHQKYEKRSCSYANPAYARYCEMCGKPTGYKHLGVFPSWEDRFSSGHPVEPVPIRAGWVAIFPDA